jgi:uncharacterized protein YecT (DUF1311 family)
MRAPDALKTTVVGFVVAMLLLRHAGPANAADCDDKTQSGLNCCCGSKLVAEEAEMNDLLRKVLLHPDTDKVTATRVRASQKAWLAFKTAQLAAMFPHNAQRQYYGSAFALCYCEAARALVADRSNQLAFILRVGEGGPECQ